MAVARVGGWRCLRAGETSDDGPSEGDEVLSSIEARDTSVGVF